MKLILLSIVFALLTAISFSTTITVINSGYTFSPDTITISVGDTVYFDLASAHNATEVSQSTWNNNGNTALSGGFQTNYGGGLVLPAQLAAGTHYYVCQPHASMGMKGVIIVQGCTPATPGTISGNTSICSSSSNTYSITAVSGATSYTWTLPSGWTGSSTSSSITATASTTSGNISVTANNSCGSSAAKTLAVTVNSIPSTPGTISGNATICSGSSNTYSITAINGATSYTWTLPSGWTGSSTSNSITATANTSGGNITVTANNTCGSSSAKTLAITVNSIPATPGIISGNTSICSTSSNTYSITAISGATTYNWTLPSGWTGTSTTNSINTIAGTTSGNISVTANNTCGSSAAQTLAVTVSSVPGSPGIISGDTNICQSSSHSYSIATINGATSYTWTLPSGWSGSSATNSISATAGSNGGNISVTANNGCGSSPVKSLSVTVNISAPVIAGIITGDTMVCDSSLNTYSIIPVSDATSYTWTLPNGWNGSSNTNSISTVVINTSGNITVMANNSCGSSAASTLNVTISGGSALPQPGLISGDTIICQGSTNTYSITAVSGATSYIWSLPNGWTGTSTTNSIEVTANITSGNITVSAKNDCGLSAIQTLVVTVNTAPTMPNSITGNTSICAASSNTFNVAVVNGATSYTWTLPSGWTGISSTNSINTTASTLSGNITVTADNACGSSAAQTLAISVNTVPNTPGMISGDTSVCASGSNTYSIAAVNGATSYTWTLPSGWTGTSVTNSIIASAGPSNGNISVTADNTCGSSSAQVLSVMTTTVNASVSQSGTLL